MQPWTFVCFYVKSAYTKQFVYDNILLFITWTVHKLIILFSEEYSLITLLTHLGRRLTSLQILRIKLKN